MIFLSNHIWRIITVDKAFHFLLESFFPDWCSPQNSLNDLEFVLLLHVFFQKCHSEMFSENIWAIMSKWLLSSLSDLVQCRQNDSAENFSRETLGGRQECGACLGSLCLSWYSSDMLGSVGLLGWILEPNRWLCGTFSHHFTLCWSCVNLIKDKTLFGVIPCRCTWECVLFV